MRADADAILPGCELAVSFLNERGRSDEARFYFDRARIRHDALAEAGEERRMLRRDEDLREHGLPEAVVAEVAVRLAAYPEVERANLGRRCLEHLDDEFPSFVLGVEFHLPRLKPHLRDPKPALVGRLAAELRLPFEFFVVDLGEEGGFRRRLRKLDGAEIYRR
jgi:GNAT superfamily N-acetyltransferase